MFTLFYRNSRLLILTIILIAVWGISSYFTKVVLHSTRHVLTTEPSGLSRLLIFSCDW